MPKLKTKSSLKKRFSRTGTGKIKFKPAGKRHGMSKRSNKFIRSTKRAAIMSPGDTALIDHMLPYNK
jgi:large subunit ribosomal protein L35